MLVRFPNLLVVDDDRYILRFLRMNLERDGFEVRIACTGQEAINQLEQGLPDLAIVDLLLPDTHGFDLCRRIKSYLDLPIIVLTAVGSEESAVEGLERYAEDYIVKPFRYGELLARINRVLKRTRHLQQESSVMQIDDHLAFDFARHLAIVGRQEVRLTPTESRLLMCLAQNYNRFVSQAAIFDQVWPDGEGDAQRLKVTMHRLRKKIEIDPATPLHLISRQKYGYRLNRVEPSASEGSPS